MIVGRIIGWLLLILALIAEGHDIWGWIDTGHYEVAALGRLWFELDRGSLVSLQSAIEGHAAWLWDPVIATTLVWLAYGAALLGLGMALGESRLRLAGLAIGALVAVKVFVFDMGALSGLYRAASFLGLGASLVGFAYLYRRLIARTRGEGAA